MLRPGAFYWHAGRLYVGYGWLSSFHEGEEPVWDPVPVPLNAVVETCNGYYHFSNMFMEKGPYFRKFAEISMLYVHKPHDSDNGFLKKKTDQGTIAINEKVVLPPDYCVEYQWDGGHGGWDQVLHRKWRAPKDVMPKIRKSMRLASMRNTPEIKQLRKRFDRECTHNLRPE